MAFDLKSIIARSAARLGPARASGRNGTNGADVGGMLQPLVPRSQTGQRLQIGLTGLASMVLVVGLASVIKDRVNQSSETVLADAGASGGPDADAVAQSDPLADAGLVPDIPAEPDPATVLELMPGEPVNAGPNAGPNAGEE